MISHTIEPRTCALCCPPPSRHTHYRGGRTPADTCLLAVLSRPKRNIKTAMNNEIMLYGIAQKEQLGFDKAVEECSARAPLEPLSRSCTLTRRFPRAQSTG